MSDMRALRLLATICVIVGVLGTVLAVGGFFDASAPDSTAIFPMSAVTGTIGLHLARPKTRRSTRR